MAGQDVGEDHHLRQAASQSAGHHHKTAHKRGSWVLGLGVTKPTTCPPGCAPAHQLPSSAQRMSCASGGLRGREGRKERLVSLTTSQISRLFIEAASRQWGEQQGSSGRLAHQGRQRGCRTAGPGRGLQTHTPRCQLEAEAPQRQPPAGSGPAGDPGSAQAQHLSRR